MPGELLLIRHGESAGNVARDRALANGHAEIDIAERDCDVPLSEAGEEQSRSLGRWLDREGRAPHVIFCSPYLRAQETARIACAAGKWSIPVIVDERLREKEFGILDRLTRSGIAARYPEQVTMRARLGKFYYRPPGGESWADVILRLRSAFDSIQNRYGGKRIAIVSHQVVVLCMRYILEQLDEAQILAIDREGDVANCSLTAYERDESAACGYRLRCYNETAPMEEEGVPITAEPDVPAGPK